MGLLDWITDGGGSLFSEGSAGPMTGNTMPPPMSAPMPPAQGLDTGATPPPPMPQAQPPLNFRRPEFDPSRAPMPPGTDPMTAGGPVPNGPGLPPPPPGGPMPQGTDPMTAGGPTPNGPGLPPTPGAIPPPPPETPPGAPTKLLPSPSYPGLAVAQPSQMPPGTPFSNGEAGLLGSAFGMSGHDATMLRGSLGAGLKAAGNSAGKSPFQALTSGAGEAIEGGQKASDTNQDQTLKYLNAAINAKKAGDTATYNTNYTKYLAAKLKADTDKAASGNAAKNSPEQLYFQAVRATNQDPALKGYNDAIRAARASGDTAAIAKAQADLEQAKAGIMNGHLGRVGLDPQTAAQIGQQPGMSQANPIDGKKAGLTPETIKKLQPGQYYTNPKDGKLYQYKGSGVKGIPDKPTGPEPHDARKPEKGSRADAGGADDEGES